MGTMGSIASPEYSRNMSGGNELLETLNANSLFMAQCIIAAVIGGLEFCFPALFVDTFNTFEVYTSHRLYGATMIVNAIIVFAMRNCSDHRVKKEIVQAFLFQFGLAAAYGYLLMGDRRKISSGFASSERLKRYQESNERLTQSEKQLTSKVADQEARIKDLTAQLADAKRKGK